MARVRRTARAARRKRRTSSGARDDARRRVNVAVADNLSAAPAPLFKRIAARLARAPPRACSRGAPHRSRRAPDVRDGRFHRAPRARLARAPARPRRAAPRARSALLPSRASPSAPPAAGGSRRGLPASPRPPARTAPFAFVPRATTAAATTRRPRPAPASSSSSSSSSSSAPLDVSALVAEVTDLSKMARATRRTSSQADAHPPLRPRRRRSSKADLGLDDGIFDRLGVPLLFVAGVLVSRGVDLGDSLTPFPRPRKDNALITSGAYAVARHPMYAGLIFGAFGLGLLTASPVRILLACSWPYFSTPRRGKEEGYLEEMHGKEAYAEYADDVPRLAPTARGVAWLLEETFPNVGQTER